LFISAESPKCVFDGKPRDWSDEQIQKLKEWASTVMDTIEERMTRERDNKRPNSQKGQYGTKSPAQP
jgi:hypothetical protein